MLSNKEKPGANASGILLLVCLLVIESCTALKVRAQSVEPARSGIDAKVDSLLKQMTLEEKIGQLTIMGADRKDLKELIREGKVGGTNGVLPGKDVGPYTREMQKIAMQSRLKIPLMFMGDVIHGFRTIFPVPIALASSWDPELTGEMDSVSAIEATTAGVDWTFTPMVDIARDPRWGRVVEGAGEDPFLGSKIAAAAVRGFQGNDLSAPHTMMATAKHFAGYGAVEAGRDYNTVDMSERRLKTTYLPPFKAAVDQGVGSIMAAFVSLNGIPATENKYLLKDILRKQWGFKGLVVSDYDAIPELQQHGVAGSPEQAARLAINAGMDVDLHSGTYLDNLPKLVKEGKVSEATIDEAVRHVLKAKYELGLFANPFRYGDTPGKNQETFLAKHRPIARDIARKSMVLLKNDNHLLPLKTDVHSIAVIGPLANDKIDLLGPVHALGRPDEAVTVLQGIKDEVSPNTTVRYAKGTDFDSLDTSGFAKAVSIARKSDVVVMVMGENAGMSGEGDSRSMLGLPGNQLDLVKAVMKTGKPVAVVLMNGRPLTIDWLRDNAPVILEAWFPGTEGGPAVADVLFGKYNPSGKLPMSFPRDVGQIPIYYNHLNTGRPYQPGNKYTSHYIDVPNTPLYPFGYGLSYTTFSYSQLHLNTQKLGWNDTLKVSIKVTNTGNRKGIDVVQLYIHDLVASVSLPVRELKGFRRVRLQPGESKEVTFRLSRDDLAFYRKDMTFGAEPGGFRVYVGDSSEAKQQATFTLVKSKQNRE